MVIKDYLEFVILTDDVQRDEHGVVNSFTVRVIKSPKGETRKETVIVPNDIDLAIYRRKLKDRELDTKVDQQTRLGELLADLLLPEHARDLFNKSLAGLRDGEGLRLRLHLANELVTLPWEYMYIKDPHGKHKQGGFLALDPRISIVRHDALEIPAPDFRTTDKRRIIIAMATPKPYSEYPKLADLPNEQKIIEDTLNLVPGIDVVYIPYYGHHYPEDIPGAREEHLTNELKQETDIFHFSGHGKFTEELGPGDSIVGKGFIILADEKNQAVERSARELADLLRDKGIRLVILGACETGGRDIFDAWNSVAASLLMNGIPVVISMQFSIYSDLATAFMEALYECLVAGLTIDEAVALGRVAIRTRVLGGVIDIRDWGVPVLYLRSEGGRVFNPVTDEEALQNAKKKVNALSLLQEGMQQLTELAFDKAIDYFLQATRANPEYSDAFKAVTWTKQSQARKDIKAGQFDEAIIKLAGAREAAIHTDCLDPRALNLRGTTAKLMAEVSKKRNDLADAKKQYTEAKRLFEFLMQLDPTDSSSRNEAENIKQDINGLDSSRKKPEPPKKDKTKKKGRFPTTKVILVGVIIFGLVAGIVALGPEWIWPTSAKINQFVVTKERITQLDSSMLIWSVSDAIEVSIFPGIGEVESIGTMSVSPKETTTYTLTATSKAGSVSAQTTVVVTGTTVDIGYISSTTTGLSTAVPYLKQIIEPDLNAYASRLGYNIKFNFVIENAEGQAAVHLEKVQGFKSRGINFLIGGGWSSMAASALSYCNNNDMLMWSSSSTSPLLAIADDNLYRMCPDDTIQATAISRMIQSMGVKYIVVIQRGDAWADGIMNFFEPHFIAHGGVILEKIRYAGEATEFANYLQSAEDKLAPAVAQYGLDKCGVEVIAFSESVTMVTQAKDFPTVYSVKWFGSDGTSLTQQFIDDAPTQSEHLHIYSTLVASPESELYTSLSERYWYLVTKPYGYYEACTYDAAWITAKAILEAQSTDPTDVIPLIASIAYDHFGASGLCRLNTPGDRASSCYQIWGYGDIGSGVQNVLYGFYNDITDSVTWNTEYLGYTPTPR